MKTQLDFFSLPMAITVTLLLFLFSHSANADWSDNFDGEFQQAWTFDSLSGSTLESSSTFTGTVDENRLRLNDPTAGANNGAAFGFGIVNEAFTDVTVSGIINPGSNFFVSQTHMLIARTDLASSTYYAAGINLQAGDLMIYRSDAPGMTTTLASTAVAGLSFAEDYYISFELAGDSLTATLRDEEGGSQIQSITATDDMLTQGHAGVLGQSSSGERILSIWDNVSAVGVNVPEPSGALLGAFAIWAIALFRRKSRE